jgi:signal transduction histidine kinase
VVRDLHDGAQARLVATVVALRLARDAVQSQEERVPALLTEALDNAEQALSDLRELAHGVLPSVLSRGGLSAAVHALLSRISVPVDTVISVGRLPTAVEAAAYFVVAEALTNITKHSRAEHARVIARVERDTLQVEVRDDGVGGARPDGSGLVGLADRLASIDGRLQIETPTGGGTLVIAQIPVAG